MKFTGILSKTNSRTANKIIQKDWSETSLGPIDEWPKTLKSKLLTMLENKFPVIIYWGPDLQGIYNDAYEPLLGTKNDVLGKNILEI